jgi:hypothetical protein
MDMIVEIDSYLMLATDLAEDAIAEDAPVAADHSDVMPTASDEQSRAVAVITSGTDVAVMNYLVVQATPTPHTPRPKPVRSNFIRVDNIKRILVHISVGGMDTGTVL